MNRNLKPTLVENLNLVEKENEYLKEKIKIIEEEKMTLELYVADAIDDRKMKIDAVRTTKKYTSVMIRVCHSRSRFLSCMYIHDDFMTESR